MKRYKHQNHSLQDSGFLWHCQQCNQQWANEPSSQCKQHPSGQHGLIQAEYRYFCEKCEQHWQTKPQTICPGVPYLPQAFPSGDCYGERVYPESIGHYIDIQLSKQAISSAVTGSTHWYIHLYSQQAFIHIPSNRFPDCDMERKLQLLEIYLNTRHQQPNAEDYTVLKAPFVVTWNILRDDLLPLVQSGTCYSLENRGHIIHYDANDDAEKAYKHIRVTKKIIASR